MSLYKVKGPKSSKRTRAESRKRRSRLAKDEGTGTASGRRGKFLNAKRRGVVKGKHNVIKERKGRREADEKN